MLCSDRLLQTTMDDSNPVQLHNRIWRDLAETEADILLPEEYEVTLENLVMSTTEDGNLLFTREDPFAPAAIHYQVSVTQELPLYIYFTAPEYQGAELLVDGENRGAYFDIRRWNMVNTGTHASGDTLSVSLSLTEDTLCLTEACFFYEDPEVLTAMAEPIQLSAPAFVQTSGTSLSGTFRAEEDQLLLFTVPRNKGWKLTIDGESVPLMTVLNTFPASHIPAGEHDFCLTYHTPGLVLGCMLGLSGLLLLLGWRLLRKKHPAQ